MKTAIRKKLLDLARSAAKNAYCPYSRYRVGTALLAADGTVFLGCNVENTSYGLTICAERTAFANAVSAGRRTFKAIAIVASGRKSPYPCGACRQVMAEFCGPDFEIVCAPIAGRAKPKVFDLARLLPKAFGR